MLEWLFIIINKSMLVNGVNLPQVTHLCLFYIIFVFIRHDLIKQTVVSCGCVSEWRICYSLIHYPAAFYLLWGTSPRHPDLLLLSRGEQLGRAFLLLKCSQLKLCPAAPRLVSLRVPVGFNGRLVLVEKRGLFLSLHNDRVVIDRGGGWHTHRRRSSIYADGFGVTWQRGVPICGCVWGCI